MGMITHYFLTIMNAMTNPAPKVALSLPDIPKLPYASDALHPFISGESLCFVYQNIMPTYYAPIPRDKSAPQQLPLIEYLINQKDPTTLYRHATEAYNHAFWLYSMDLSGGGKPRDTFFEKIVQDFGSFDNFYGEFIKKATAPESIDAKWLWLASNETGKLTIFTTDQYSPLTLGFVPLIACNLWQHAYYLDYRDRKADYVRDFLDHLINWQHAEASYYNPHIWVWQG